MSIFKALFRPFLILTLVLLPGFGFAADYERFFGKFSGHAEFTADGKTQERDMSVAIEPAKDGFVLTWTSVTYKGQKRTKEKTYSIEFVPSGRDNIYQSAMRSNLFGKAVPLNPLAGEPFVWARLQGDTLSVFSLFIDESGEYEMQEFHRTLVDAGLDLVFLRVRDGAIQREIRTTLLRQE